MQIDSNFEFPIKLVIIGDSGIGKTNFIFQFTENRFSPLHVATVGFDYKSKIIKLPASKKKVKIQIWDTAGQERYTALNKNIFQQVQGIILMYDITNRKSFDNINKWLNLIYQTCGNKVKILVGNKLDLSDESRIVTEDEGKKLAEDNNMAFFEGSGSSGENVEEIFQNIAESVYNSLVDGKESICSSMQLNQKKGKKKKKCC